MFVLVCDDMATDRANLKKILTELGHTVDTVNNGEEAVAAVTARQPDVMFCDVVMPKMDGFATVRAIKSNPATKGFPIIMCTSKGTSADKFWAQQQGAAGHITKPATAQNVTEALRIAGLL